MFITTAYFHNVSIIIFYSRVLIECISNVVIITATTSKNIPEILVVRLLCTDPRIINTTDINVITEIIRMRASILYIYVKFSVCVIIKLLPL